MEMCSDVKMACNKDVRCVFQKAGEQLTDDLTIIRKHEKRINADNEQQILQLNHITSNKKALAVELRQIIDSVKGLDYTNKNISN